MARFHRIHEWVAAVTLVGAAALATLGVQFGFWIAGPVVGLLWIYLFPLALHRLQTRFTPIPLGTTQIRAGEFHPWLASHRIQRVFIAFPIFETMLGVVPGLFPLWLRLWGSRIGKNVSIAPGARIYDRSLVEIGDHAVIGEGCVLASHLINRRGKTTELVCLPVRVGPAKLIGGYSMLAPGTRIVDLEQVPAFSLCPVDSTDAYFSVSKFGMNELRTQGRI